MIACEDVPTNADFMALQDLSQIDVDLRYTTPNNFLNRVLYQGIDCAYLRVETALALEKAGQWLSTHSPGTRIRVLDALRPQRIQEQLYREFENTPQAMYLAHPERGSIHSFGMAVDVTLLDADFEYQTPASTRPADQGSLEWFLVERYLLFSANPAGELFSGRVRHHPYQIAPARCARWSAEPLRLDGFPAPTGPPASMLAAAPVDVSIFPLRRCNA